MVLKQDSLTGIPYNDYDDYSTGRDVLKYFHNRQVSDYPDVYKINFETFLRLLSDKHKLIIDGIGLAVINAEMSVKQYQLAMEVLADQSQGRIPETTQAFYQALQGIAVQGSWVDMATFVGIQTVISTTDVLERVGNTIGDAVETTADTAISLVGALKWLVPLSIVGIGLILYKHGLPKDLGKLLA